jgi:hypothetical protein
MEFDLPVAPLGVENWSNSAQPPVECSVAILVRYYMVKMFTDLVLVMGGAFDADHHMEWNGEQAAV